MFFCEDAIMVSYLINYKIYYNDDKLCVSFTDKSLSIVLSRLRIRKISYILINKEVKEQFVGIILEYNNLKILYLEKNKRNIWNNGRKIKKWKEIIFIYLYYHY